MPRGDVRADSGPRGSLRRAKTFECIVCGGPFESKQAKARCCGPVCIAAFCRAAQAKRQPPRPKRSCVHCGKDFAPYNLSAAQRRIGHVQRCCSNACARSAKRKYASRSEQKRAYRARKRARRPKPPPTFCKTCNQPNPPNRRVFCCLDCDRASRMVDSECRECGAGFRDLPSRRFCSPACRASFVKATKRHRDKARHLGIAYENFSPTAVFERDGWRCKICGVMTTGRSKPGEWDPLAASLDHIRPTSRRGEHTMANTRCAHRICNAKKRDLWPEEATVPALDGPRAARAPVESQPNLSLPTSSAPPASPD